MCTHLENLGVEPACLQALGSVADLLMNAVALERDEAAVRIEEGSAPTKQLVHVRDGPTGDDIECLISILCSAPDDLDAVLKSKVLHSLAQEVEPTQQRFQQRHLQIRA